MAILVPSATSVVSTAMVVSSCLFMVLTDKNGATMDLCGLEFINGTDGLSCFLIDDSAAAN